MTKGLSTVGAIIAAIAVSVSASTTSVSSPLNVTNSQFAGNEESLGMDSTGTLLAASWNDWHYNDGCGFTYSTDGGTTWAPQTFAPFTSFTNDPDLPGAGRFPIAGDPVVVWNPAFHTFDVICQAFGLKAGQIQLLSATFDPARANASANENFSYGTAVGGAPAWTAPVPITTGKSNGSQKGSIGKFPDHEAGVVDTGTTPGHHFGRLYIAWAEFNGLGRSPIELAYSDDNGVTWTGPDLRQRRRAPVRPGRDSSCRPGRLGLCQLHQRAERKEPQEQRRAHSQIGGRREYLEPELHRG